MIHHAMRSALAPLHERHSTASWPCSLPPAPTPTTWSAVRSAAACAGRFHPGHQSPCSALCARTTAARLRSSAWEIRGRRTRLRCSTTRRWVGQRDWSLSAPQSRHGRRGMRGYRFGSAGGVQPAGGRSGRHHGIGSRCRSIRPGLPGHGAAVMISYRCGGGMVGGGRSLVGGGSVLGGLDGGGVPVGTLFTGSTSAT
jgi:hypothetical protein